MRRVNPDDGALRVPADVWGPREGESRRVWLERAREWWKSNDFAAGRTVFAPDGSVFFEPGGEPDALFAVVRHHARVRRGE